MAAGRSDEALAAHEQAVHLAPQAKLYGIILEIAKRKDAARSAPQHPDFSKMQREYQRAKEEALQREARRRQRQLDGEPTPDMPMPGQPISGLPAPNLPMPGLQVPGLPLENNHFGLPPSQLSR